MRFPFLALVAVGIVTLHASAGRDWSVYLGDKAASHYSTLAQITPTNVAKLDVAWVFHAGDMREGATQIQCNPLIIGGVLYATTPQSKVIALDAATGHELWRFAPLEPTVSTAGLPTGRTGRTGASSLATDIGCTPSMPVPAG